MTLYEETKKILEYNNKNFDDVVAICGNKFQISKEDFIEYSKTRYDKGYGAPEVATDLLVIGEDFWLERNEYDGSEWWEFKSFPQYENLPFQKIKALTVNQAHANGVKCSCGWETLDALN